jgi:iduronate 2-sulfatase
MATHRHPVTILQNHVLPAQAEEQGWKRGPAYESADVPDDTYADGKLAAKACDCTTCVGWRRWIQPFFLAVGFFQAALAFRRSETILGFVRRR